MKSLITFFLIGIQISLHGQDTTHQVGILKTDVKIKIDGALDESAWHESDVALDFWEKWPRDDNHPKNKTEVRITYDDTFLYVGAICYDSGRHIIQSLKRDTRYWDSDGFAVILDPIGQRINGYVFGVSPQNVQSETLIGTNGGFGDFTWDTKWLSTVKRHDNKWVVEIAIPFRSLSFKEGSKEWGINFMRNDMKNNMYHTWTRIPVQLFGNDLAYVGNLIWDSPPKKKSGSVQLLPYVTTSAEKVAGETTASVQAGLDSKIAISSSLNLDVTINPDFSQVEVDQQQINLTRFSLLFPEKRSFFVENSDLFASFGNDAINPNGVVNPIYTRSVGLDRNGQKVPLIGGLRLNGNLTKNLRIGLMDMQTKSLDNELSKNYSAFAFNQKILKRSSVKGYVTNVQDFQHGHTSRTNYDGNAGTEFAYFSLDGSLQAWASAHHSFKPSYDDNNNMVRAGGTYKKPAIAATIDLMKVGTNYYAPMGYVPRIENYDVERDTTIRVGFQSLYARVDYFFRNLPKTKINIINPDIETSVYWNPDGSLNERMLTIANTISLRSTTSFSIQVQDRETNLLFPFKFTDGEPLPAASYRYQLYGLTYKSDDRKKFRLNASLNTGEFYNGKIRQYIIGFIFRQQPWTNVSINLERDELTFPQQYGVSNRTLINSRVEIFFSNKLNWTTFFQYNTQSNNININSRVQWRYRPMSDIFLVYTDNYFSDPIFKNKDRAIVLKVNYWLNL